jgi:carbamoyl-phosphate synthase large subunit
VILGGGPNRIGQGIEFDYCCCHAAFALDAGYESDHGQLQPGNRVDRLRHLRPALFRTADRRGRARDPPRNRKTGKLLGVIVQFGGQTPLKLADALEKAGIPILGTSPDMIDLAEDRDRFQKLLTSSTWFSPTTASPIRSNRPGWSPPTRLPAGRPPLLRAGRPRHADHPRRRA